jgi:hypothetical protein
MYLLHYQKTANTLADKTNKFIDQELTYIASLEPRFYEAYLRDIKIGLLVLNHLQSLSTQNNQKDLSIRIKNTYEKLSNRFS